MAVLTATAFYSGTNPVTATVNTATASDTLTYTAGGSQMLELDNTGGSLLTVVIAGTAPSAAYPIPNTHTFANLSAGLSVAVAIGTKRVINLDKISAFLAGSTAANNVTLSGASGLKITIYQ